MSDQDTLLSVSEAAKISGYPAITIRKAAASGSLKATKAGERAWVVKRSDLDAWIQDENAHKTGRKPKNVNSG